MRKDNSDLNFITQKSKKSSRFSFFCFKDQNQLIVWGYRTQLVDKNIAKKNHVIYGPKQT